MRVLSSNNIYSTLLQQNTLVGLVCLGLPFIILYWLVPAFSELTIGNDYGVFPIQHQMALMFSVENGSFPLYVPGFAKGQSATALTLGQIYHPFFYISSVFDSYWQGEALTIHTWLRLVSVGVTHLILFLLMRALGFNMFLAFILSFITVYNLRMLDMFRYGAALENYTAFIALCSFILFQALQFKRRYFIGVAVSAYLLTVGGHPQIAYICFLGAAILTLIAPFYLSTLKSGIGTDRASLLNYWLLILLATTLGILMAAPYALGFYFDFLPYNSIRADSSYEWSLAYQNSWGGLFRSFYAPLETNVSGAFGGSALIILVLLFPLYKLLSSQKTVITWVIFGVGIFAFLVSSGDATPVHRWVWEYFPLASNFRTPGRFSLLLLFPMLLLLAWMFHEGMNTVQQKQVVPVIKSQLALVLLCSCILLLGFNVAFDHLFPDPTWPAPGDINDVSQKVMDIALYCGIAVLLAFAIYFELHARHKGALANAVGVLVVLIMCFEMSNTLRYGTWVVTAEAQKSDKEFEQYLQDKYAIAAVPGVGLSMGLIDERVEKSILETKLARFYRKVVALDDEQQLEQFLVTDRKPSEAVILAAPSATKVSQLTTDNGQMDTVSLKEFHYNQYVFKVTAIDGGLLSTNLPYRENWQAYVDGVPAEVFKANGYEVSVLVPAGEHEVLIQYESNETRVGMMIAMLTVIGLLIWLGVSSTSRTQRIALFAACVLPVVVFVVWSNSLHGGKAFNVAYQWDSSMFPSDENLAYGKLAQASSNGNIQMAYFQYAGLAVDGNRTGDLFSTARQQRPMWKLDLGEVKEVERIDIYGIARRSIPMTVWLSDDDKEFKRVGVIQGRSRNANVELESGSKSRYIFIRSERNTTLTFREVEVYGPEKRQEAEPESQAL